MKLLYIEDEMTIIHNRCETSMENIFGLDEQNNIIQGFTFPTDITIVDKTKFDETVNNSKKQYLENGFLFYSFSYQISFAHYMTQTVPKLYEYINNYSNYKLLNPNNSYNKLCKDILQKLNINIENIKKSNSWVGITIPLVNDFNNDGFQDLFVSFMSSENESVPFKLFLYDALEKKLVDKSSLIIDNIGQPFSRRAMCADLNGDKILDFVCVSHPESGNNDLSYFDIVLSEG